MKNVVNMVFGSHLYGTNTENSDMDYKGVFIPHPSDIVMGRGKETKQNNTNDGTQRNTKDDIDIEWFTLKKFIGMCCMGETVAIDMLHAPDSMIIETSQIWQYIRNHRHEFYTGDMRAYLSYVKQQAAKYGVKGSRLSALSDVHNVISATGITKIVNIDGVDREVVVRLGDVIHLMPIIEPYCVMVDSGDERGMFYEVLGKRYQLTTPLREVKTSIGKAWENYGHRARQAELNQGIDWKALSHAYRAGVQLLEIYDTGDLKMPLRDAGQILMIKQGQCNFKIVQENLEYVIDEVEKKAHNAVKNGLREKADTDRWNKFIEDIYSGAVVEYYSH